VIFILTVLFTETDLSVDFLGLTLIFVELDDAGEGDLLLLDLTALPVMTRSLLFTAFSPL